MRNAVGAWRVKAERVEVTGFERPNGTRRVYRGREYVIDVLPKVECEIITMDEMAKQMAETIERAARTRWNAAGKILVIDAIPRAWRQCAVANSQLGRFKQP